MNHNKLGDGGDVRLIDAIQELNQNYRVFAYEFEGNRFDEGEKVAFIKTIIEVPF
ncbi:hypothetical protein [Bacillus sp. CECT 9360]|uniref:hypothetical protein n=1 Tax=Bacillus sp. CECT 9360 TaxID=2845821 RepID=UPI001E2BB94B|nr:hypothetical protein [Bacillus sp. CECT 9360]